MPEIEASGVSKLLRQLKPDKAASPDAIYARVLKELHVEISSTLALIFNKSPSEGKIIFAWKEANIIPVFKKGSKLSSFKLPARFSYLYFVQNSTTYYC